MSKTCEIVYFDKHGNRAASYYGNLHLGHENALKIYLEDMAEHAYTKFQKAKMTPDEFIKISKDRVQNPGETIDNEDHYVKDGVRLDRTTHVTSSFKEEFVEDEAALELAIRNRAKELLHKTPKTYGLTLRQVENGQYNLLETGAIGHAYEWAFGDAYNADDHEGSLSALTEDDYSPELLKRIKSIKQQWDFKREGGTSIHRVLESYINALNNIEPDEDGYKSKKDIEKAKSLALEEADEYVTENDLKRLLNDIDKFIADLGKDKKKLRFETEVSLWDEELGIGGSVDLMVFDENDNVYIFDYKTKERGKEWLFDWKKHKRKGPLSNLWDNKETDGALQTSMYRVIMERKGFNVASSSIIYLEGDMVWDESLQDYRYENLSHKKNIRLPNLRSEVGKLLMEVKGKDIGAKKVIEEGKLNFANEMINNVVGDSLESRQTIESKVKHAYNRIISTPDGKGRLNYYDHNKAKRHYFKATDGEEEIKAELTKYYKERETSSITLATNLIKYFDTGKWEGKARFPDVAQREADAMLAGLDPEKHTLDKLKNIYGFEHVSDDILIAINQRNGAARLINVSNKDSKLLGLDDKKNPKDKNIFAKEFSDDTMKRKYKMDGLEATSDNAKILQSALLGLELLKSGLITRVESIRSGSVTGYQQFNGDVTLPKDMSMGAMIKHLKVLRDFNGDIMSTHYKELLNDSELMDESRHQETYMDSLYDLIQDGLSGIRKDRAEYFKEVLEKNRKGELGSDAELIRVLLKIQKDLGRTLTDDASRAESLDYRLVSQAILQMTNIRYEMGEMTKKLGWENMVRTTSRIDSDIIKQLDFHVKKTKQSINRKFKAYKREHDKLLHALLAHHNIDKTLGPNTKGWNQKVLDVFSKLYKVDPRNRTPESDIKNVENLFMLKDENDPTLSTPEKDYIKFFNRMTKEGWKMTLDEKSYKHIEDGSHWKEGTVPLMFKGQDTKKSEAKFKEDIKMRIDSMSKNVKNEGEDFKAINTRLDNRFYEQKGGGIQNGAGRLYMLGLDPDGERRLDDEGHNFDNLEVNLEAILNNFFNDSLRTSEFEETLGIYNALNTAAYIAENEHFNSTEQLRDYMARYVKLIIFNEVNKEENQWADKAGKIMTAASLGFSPKQVALESITNIFASGSSILQQMFMGSEKRFSPADWAKAGAMLTGQKVKGVGNHEITMADAIMNEFGIHMSDSEAFGTTEFQETNKNNLFQSKWLYTLNNLPFKYFRQQTFMAELVHQGIDKAMSLNDDGSIKYDASLDPRFKDIFVGGKMITDFNTDNQKKQKALFDSIVEDLANEDGGVDLETGMPLRPLPVADILSILDYTRTVYGSMDSDQKVLAQASSYGRMFLKFKNWVVAKKDNYWTKTGKSDLRGVRKWIEDPSMESGGYYEWAAEDVEGIIQTIGHLKGAVVDILRSEDKDFKNFKDVFTHLNKNQRENLAKLSADVVLVSILTLLFGALFEDDWFKSGEGKLLSQTMMNATADLNILALSSNMSTGSPVAVLSWINRSVENAASAVSYAAAGDIDKGAIKLGKMTGMGKTVVSFFE